MKFICHNPMRPSRDPVLNTIPCDICGEDYLPHMLNTNSFPSQLTCEMCDAQLERDFEQEKWNKVDFDVEHGGDWD